MTLNRSVEAYIIARIEQLTRDSEQAVDAHTANELLKRAQELEKVLILQMQSTMGRAR